MATMTSVAPIGIDQVNTDFFVYGANGEGFDSIQQAVDYVRLYNNGVGRVVICHGYGYTEDIASLTGGGAATYLTDLRDAKMQDYVWDTGTGKFISANFAQLGIITSPVYRAQETANGGAGQMDYVDALHRTRFISDSPTGAMGQFEFSASSSPSGFETYLTMDDSAATFLIPLTAATATIGSLTLGGAPLDPTTIAHTNQANRFTAPQTIDSNLTVSGYANIGGPLDTDDAFFTTCLVSGSPVRTIANSPDAPAGVPVATGTGWGISIDPATLPRTNTPNTFTAPQTISATLTLAADPALPLQAATKKYVDDAIAESGNFVYPGAGIAVSTGSAWDSAPDGKAFTNKALVTYGSAGMLDVSKTSVQMGVGVDHNRPNVYFIDSGSAANNRASGIATFQDSGAGPGMELFFGDDAGYVYPWLTAWRSGTTATGVEIAPPVKLDSTLTLAADPAQPLQAATKQYVDAKVGGIYPAAGVPVSTGTGWGTSIPAGNIALLNVANTFTANQTVNGTLNATTRLQSPQVAAGSTGLFIAGDAPGGYVSFTFNGDTTDANRLGMVGGGPGDPKLWFDSHAGGGFNFRSAGDIIAEIDGTKIKTYGMLLANQTISGLGGLKILGTPTQPVASTLGVSTSSSTCFIDMYGQDAGNFGQFIFRVMHGDNSANVQLLQMTSTAITADLTFTAGNGIVIPVSATNPSTPSNASLYVVGGANYLVIDPPKTGSLLLNWDGGTGGVIFGNGAGGNIASIDSTGTGTFNGSLAALNANFTGDMTVGSGGRLFLGNWVSTGTKPSLTAVGANIVINPNAAGQTIINRDGGTNGVVFADASGTGAIVATIDIAGNAHFNGTVTAGSKSFRIAHPLDSSKRLTHGSLEGPEHGVYYRGESATKNGTVTVTLPDYFEALTTKEGRTVQLTEKADTKEMGSHLAASSVKDGKFTVRSTSPAVKFFWEVKAVRAGVSIDVVSDVEAA